MYWWCAVGAVGGAVFVGGAGGAGGAVFVGGTSAVLGAVGGAVSAVPIGPPVTRTRALAGGSAPVGACRFGAMSLSRRPVHGAGVQGAGKRS